MAHPLGWWGVVELGAVQPLSLAQHSNRRTNPETAEYIWRSATLGCSQEGPQPGVPAKGGTHSSEARIGGWWVPAFIGTRIWGRAVRQIARVGCIKSVMIGTTVRNRGGLRGRGR